MSETITALPFGIQAVKRTRKIDEYGIEQILEQSIEVTPSFLLTILGTFTPSSDGVVPTPNEVGTTKFLREDGTWHIPAGGGGGITFDSQGNAFAGGGGTHLDPAAGDNIGIGGVSIDDATSEGALQAITTGLGNVAIGSSTLAKLTTSQFNVAIGDSALYNCTEQANVAIGAYAGFNITTGNSNVIVGAGALGNITTGSTNLAVGTNAGGSATTTASGNVFVGQSSGQHVGGTSNSVFIGNNANAVVSGFNGEGIAIGHSSVCADQSVALGATALANFATSVALGYAAVTTGSNQCVIGGIGALALSLGFSGTTPPADDEIAAGQCFLYFDFTDGAPLMKAKGKTLDGTVFNKTITWA